MNNIKAYSQEEERNRGHMERGLNGILKRDYDNSRLK